MSEKVVLVAGGHSSVNLWQIVGGHQATHAYGTGYADWTLTASENQAGTLICTGSSATGSNIIASPFTNRIVFVDNQCASMSLTIKASGGTGILIGTSKKTLVRANGTDFIDSMSFS